MFLLLSEQDPIVWLCRDLSVHSPTDAAVASSGRGVVGTVIKDMDFQRSLVGRYPGVALLGPMGNACFTF